MRSIIILLGCLFLCGNLSVQKKKTTNKPAVAANNSAMTNKDANDFIRYSNGVYNFFSIYKIEDFMKSYQQIMRGEGSGTRMPVEADFYSKSYEQFNRMIADDHRSEYINLSTPPAKIGAEKVLRLKQIFVELKVAHEDYAQYFNETIRVQLKEGMPIKNKKKYNEALPLTQELEKKILVLHKLQQEAFAIAEEIGDKAEEITLAKHPMKTEIMDMRRSIKIAKNIAQLSQVETKAEFGEILPKIKEEEEKLKAIQQKYEGRSVPQSKNNAIYAMNNRIQEFYDLPTKDLFEAIEKSAMYSNSKEAKEDFWRRENNRILINYERMINYYKGVIEINNKH